MYTSRNADASESINTKKLSIRTNKIITTNAVISISPNTKINIVKRRKIPKINKQKTSPRDLHTTKYLSEKGQVIIRQ